MHARLEVLAKTIGQDADSLSAQAARIESLLGQEARPARFGALFERIAALERGIAEIGDALVSEFSTGLGAEVAGLRREIAAALPSESAKEAILRLESRFDRLAVLFEERNAALDSKLGIFDGALTEIRWSLANRPGVDRLERKVAELCRKVDVLLDQGVGEVLERSLDEFIVKIDRSRDEMARLAREPAGPSVRDDEPDAMTASLSWERPDDPLRQRRPERFGRACDGSFPAPAVTPMDRLSIPAANRASVPIQEEDGSERGRRGTFRRRALAVASVALLLAFAAWLFLGRTNFGPEPLKMLDAIRAEGP